MRGNKLNIVLGFGVFFIFQQCTQQKQFTEMSSDETGLQFNNQITETEHNNIMTYEYTYNGGGVAVGDINNDGLTDVYLSGNSVPNKLYLNKGNWKFEDITKQTNTAGRGDWKTGVTMVDINGDGRLDIYVCYSGNAPGEGYNKPVIIDHPKRINQLFINEGEKNGTPAFTERAKEFGLDAPGTFSTQAYFTDYDKDGDLDMFLLNHANMFYSVYFNVKKLRNLRHPYFGNKLFRNDNNKFVEVSEQSGIYGSGLNFGLSASISDLNNDGWPDIYVTNDYDEQDFCYINKKDGTFKEVSHHVFGHLSKFGMGSDIADINNDGLPDIYVADMLPEDNHRRKLLKSADDYDKYTISVDSGYHHQYMRNTLQLNRGMFTDSLPRYSEVAQLAGVASTDWSWAPLFSDFNNDGLKDLFVTNGYLRDFTNLDFIKYKVGEASQVAQRNGEPLNMLELIKSIPSTKINNYIFMNVDGVNFTNSTEAWGLTQKAISNAAVYADLDNDGDNDLIASNINDEISVLQNHQETIQKNNYIKIKLSGNKPNTFGIGSKVWISFNGKKLLYEANFTRGYQSSVEPLFTIGIGKAAKIQEVKVEWPDGKLFISKNINANQSITIHQESAIYNSENKIHLSESLFKDVTPETGIDFIHHENHYIDFKSQLLLTAQLSKLGGKLSVGDVNDDGNDDVFLCGASGQGGKLYYGSDNGKFVLAGSQPWEIDKKCEDYNATFFDADKDGDVDLYVVSGGNEFLIGDPYYQDRLYINDGKGVFTKTFGILPTETISGSCVTACDYDKDGDLDLFVGGRLTPQYYPVPSKNLLLRNDSQKDHLKFTEVTKEVCVDLYRPGMVTDAVWADINNDSWQDLIVVGEWMPVKVFQNNKGKLNDISIAANLGETSGWWSKISPGDFDGDGDVDFLAGNAGDNLLLHATVDEPVMCHTVDINNDGKLDPILSYYNQGKSFPFSGRDEILEQVPPLKKKFVKYENYSDATINDILDNDQLSKTVVLKAQTLKSVFIENKGDNKFTTAPLPYLSQFSMINGFLFDDFDGDSEKEILAAGNFYPYKVQIGRSDASMGSLIKVKNGKISSYKSNITLWLTGDIRDISVIKSRKAKKRIIVSRNNDRTSVYEIENSGQKLLSTK